MLAQGTGRIINVVSLLAERGMTNGGAYCAAQAGVLNLTRALSLEWARTGITVNAIGAGWTEGMGLIADDALRQQLLRYVPHRRLAQPQEISAAAVYLASDAAGFVTGQVLWIDGGVRSRL
jgi:NAD(P)-dependent dehydrogenase (short-subunit alcohol dehydrogenase family)